MKELIPNKGKISIRGNISFTPQESWLFTGTIRDNILFGDKFDEDKYQRVLKACCLEKVVYN